MKVRFAGLADYIKRKSRSKIKQIRTKIDDGVRESLSPEIMPSATLVNNGAKFD